MFLELPESADVIDDMAVDAVVDTDEAMDGADDDSTILLYAYIILYYTTVMINLTIKRIH